MRVSQFGRDKDGRDAAAAQAIVSGGHARIGCACWPRAARRESKLRGLRLRAADEGQGIRPKPRRPMRWRVLKKERSMSDKDALWRGDSPDEEDFTTSALRHAKIANEIVVARDGRRGVAFFLFGEGTHAGRDRSRRRGDSLRGPSPSCRSSRALDVLRLRAGPAHQN